MTIHHVSVDGSDASSGEASAPFRTIGRAADVAVPGDTVRVHAGEYREWVRPRRGGLSDTRRITYEAAPGEHVVIKGSERVTEWVPEGAGVWRASLPNAIFGDWNPYAITVEGDWLLRPLERPVHLGDVYLDGTSCYEAPTRGALGTPERRDRVIDDRTGRAVPVRRPDETTSLWFAQVDADTTTIWATFGGADPHEHLVEVNVRRSVFHPVTTGVDFITVRGFELAHAATPWAPPTGDQPGLIGPNWAKGWIIEDNHIHHAKCSAVSLGKEASTGDNNYTRRGDKPGYQYQLESVFSAAQIGWSKERIGGHVVRRNVIHDCGQNGIVGHLGCVFSAIHDNDIFDIATKREFYGHEIGGIKLHAAIDVEIAHNHIHDCALGIWLDWQTQGTRVTRNVLNGNARDLYVEVSHGPYVVDHNVLASPASVETMSQGGAYVGNLITGTVLLQPVMDRATPYHVPHSTVVAGYAIIYGADDRWWGNILVGPGGDPADTGEVYPVLPGEATVRYGTSIYDGRPASLDDYLQSVRDAQPGDVNIFKNLPQHAEVKGNVYLHGAEPFDRERGALVVADADPRVVLGDDDDGAVRLDITLPDPFDAHRPGVPSTAELGRTRMSDADFEAPDGSPIDLSTDLLGERVPGCVAGPLSALHAGRQSIIVWRRP